MIPDAPDMAEQIRQQQFGYRRVSTEEAVGFRNRMAAQFAMVPVVLAAKLP